jgi:hypothetical protein
VRPPRDWGFERVRGDQRFINRNSRVQPTDWGFESQGYFDSPDATRLLGVSPQQ